MSVSPCHSTEPSAVIQCTIQDINEQLRQYAVDNILPPWSDHFTLQETDCTLRSNEISHYADDDNFCQWLKVHRFANYLGLSDDVKESEIESEIHKMLEDEESLDKDTMCVVFGLSKIYYGNQRKRQREFASLAAAESFDIFEVVTDKVHDEYLATPPDDRQHCIDLVRHRLGEVGVLPYPEWSVDSISRYLRGRRDLWSLRNIALTGEYGLSFAMLTKFCLNLLEIIDQKVDDDKFPLGYYSWILPGKFQYVESMSAESSETPWTRLLSHRSMTWSIVDDEKNPLSQAVPEDGAFMTLLRCDVKVDKNRRHEELSMEFGTSETLKVLGFECENDWLKRLKWEKFMSDFVHPFVCETNEHTIGFYICKDKRDCNRYAAYMTWMNGRFRIETRENLIQVLFEICGRQSFGVKDEVGKKFDLETYFVPGCLEGKIRRGDGEYFVVFYLNYETFLRSKQKVKCAYRRDFKLIEDLTIDEFETVFVRENGDQESTDSV